MEALVVAIGILSLISLGIGLIALAGVFGLISRQNRESLAQTWHRLWSF